MGRIWLIGAVTAITGCAPVQVWHQEAVSFARLEADLTQCEVRAVNDVPANTQTRRTPLRYIPGRTYCKDTSDGKVCRTTASRFEGGETYTVDVNAPLRERVLRQCMGARGYALKEMPRCTQADLEKVSGDISQMGPIGENSCATQANTGIWAIITPQ